MEFKKYFIVYHCVIGRKRRRSDARLAFISLPCDVCFAGASGLHLCFYPSNVTAAGPSCAQLFLLYFLSFCANIDCVYNCITLGMSSHLSTLSHGPIIK